MSASVPPQKSSNEAEQDSVSNPSQYVRKFGSFSGSSAVFAKNKPLDTEGSREVQSTNEGVEQSQEPPPPAQKGATSPPALGPNSASIFCTTLFSARRTSLRHFLNKTNEQTEDHVNNPNATHEYPSFFSELFLSLDSSVMIYAYTALRRLAHEGKIENAEAVLKLPITTSDTIDYMNRNRALIKENLGETNHLVFEKVMDNAEKRQEEASTVNGVTYKQLEDRRQLGVFDFGDLHQNKECVYCVYVNGIAKRVSVIFRGSVTKKDWSTDMKFSLRGLPTDIFGEKCHGAKVHSGFYDYLFTDTIGNSVAFMNPELNADIENRVRTKYEAIMAVVTKILKMNPGFQLHTTGHSLGGALATMFAAHAAASKDSKIPKPVLCVTYASPRVGNMGFRRLCQELEQEGKLRCMRVVNEMDVIPHSPSKGCFRIFFVFLRPSLLYRHVGFQLKLLERKRGFEISYSRFRTGWALFWFDLLSTIKRLIYGWLFWTIGLRNAMRYHSCNEHFDRLVDNWDAFNGLSINDFYEEIQCHSGLYYKYRHDRK